MAAIRAAGFQPATECDSHSAKIYREVFGDGITVRIEILDIDVGNAYAWVWLKSVKIGQAVMAIEPFGSKAGFYG
ncbi:MAG: hypothetical protein DRP64_15560 [Verrucomicrobia bacterium]|nr:MAG: hypothetical protein DRP64_15560 [Verrucomicrobiota bacterium]